MKSILPLVLAFASLAGSIRAQTPVADNNVPHLQKNGAAAQLIVDGKPFLALAGELHNSSATGADYLKLLWPKLPPLSLNTVLAAIPWDMIEPAEGRFDFSKVDSLLEQARANQLRVAVLWFGSYKNGLSHYVPAWVKADSKRFPRALTRSGTPEILSTLSEANREADAKAFAALMRHLREVDSQQHTVIMIQVENEVGLHADTRDRSEAANAAFGQPVPAELSDYLQKNRDTLTPHLHTLWQKAGFKTSGAWESFFGKGPGADEAFMAWNYARYLNRVTEAGKAEYPLPMFVNTWIVQPDDEFPGEYPSGGPQAHVLDLWRAGAPKVDMFCPDIYLPNFSEVCGQFARPGQPFFVPESRMDEEGVANAFLAIGRYNSIGYSPFGIDGVGEVKFGRQIVSEWPKTFAPMLEAYDVLRQLAPMILDAQAKGAISAVSLSTKNQTEKIQIGGYTLHTGLLTAMKSPKLPERGYGIILAAGPDEFIIAGAGLQVQFTPDPINGGDTAGLATVEEGIFDGGKWLPGRLLNGDEIMLSYDIPTMNAARMTGTGLRFPGPAPSILRVKLYRYPQAR